MAVSEPAIEPYAEETEDAWPPPGAVLVLAGTVYGAPRPAGSKWSGVVTVKDPATGKRVPKRRPDGKGWETFTKDDADGGAWRSDIRDAVLGAWEGRAPLDGPLALSLTFYGERPKGHYGTGRNADILKPSAPAYPHAGKLPDGVKLTRAFEDALNKLVWTDDRRFVDHRISRRYGPPRAEYRLYRLPTAAANGADQLPLAAPTW